MRLAGRMIGQPAAYYNHRICLEIPRLRPCLTRSPTGGRIIRAVSASMKNSAHIPQGGQGGTRLPGRSRLRGGGLGRSRSFAVFAHYFSPLLLAIIKKISDSTTYADGDSIPPPAKKNASVEGSIPRPTRAPLSITTRIPPDCFYDSTGAVPISRRSVCSPRNVE